MAAPGELRITVRSDDHRTKQGRAALRIARWNRPPEARRGELQLGFVAFGAACEQAAARHARVLDAARQTNCTKQWRISRRRTTSGCAHRLPIFWPTCSTAPATNGRPQYAPRKSQRMRTSPSDDEAGIHNAATLRSAAEIALADAMNAGTQRAEQRALYATADRRLAAAVDFFQSHAMPVRAQYATNMRAVLAVSTADYDAASTLLARSIEMARANNDVAEQAKSLSNLAAVHNFRGFLAQAAKEYEALLPLVDPQAQPYQYAALLGNYGFTLIALGDFDRALDLAHRGPASSTRRSARRPSVPSNWRRWADSICAWVTPSAPFRPCGLRSSNTNASETTAGSPGRCASPPTPLRFWASAMRPSAICASRSQIDANPYSVARTRVLLAAELRVAGKLAEAEAELVEPLDSCQCAGACGSARRTRASAPRAGSAGRRHRGSARRRTVNTRRSVWNSIASTRTRRFPRRC